MQTVGSNSVKINDDSSMIWAKANKLKDYYIIIIYFAKFS